MSDDLIEVDGTWKKKLDKKKFKEDFKDRIKSNAESRILGDILHIEETAFDEVKGEYEQEGFDVSSLGDDLTVPVEYQTESTLEVYWDDEVIKKESATLEKFIEKE
mgnify:CR=1 FL=1